MYFGLRRSVLGRVEVVADHVIAALRHRAAAGDDPGGLAEPVLRDGGDGGQVALLHRRGVDACAQWQWRTVKTEPPGSEAGRRGEAPLRAPSEFTGQNSPPREVTPPTTRPPSPPRTKMGPPESPLHAFWYGWPVRPVTKMSMPGGSRPPTRVIWTRPSRCVPAPSCGVPLLETPYPTMMASSRAKLQ